MTTPYLEALLIDQALGELPEEVDTLLEAYLASSPARREEALAMRATLGETLQFTGEVVATCPELFTPVGPALRPALKEWIPMAAMEAMARPWLRLAAVFLALALAAGAGYFSGRDAAGGLPGAVAEETRPGNSSESSPWARYVVAADGRLAVVPAPQPGS